MPCGEFYFNSFYFFCSLPLHVYVRTSIYSCLYLGTSRTKCKLSNKAHIKYPQRIRRIFYIKSNSNEICNEIVCFITARITFFRDTCKKINSWKFIKYFPDENITLKNYARKFPEIFRDSPIFFAEFLSLLLNTYIILFTHSEKIRFFFWKSLIFSSSTSSGNFRKNESSKCAHCFTLTPSKLFQKKWEYLQRNASLENLAKNLWFSMIFQLSNIHLKNSELFWVLQKLMWK